MVETKVGIEAGVETGAFYLVVEDAVTVIDRAVELVATLRNPAGKRIEIFETSPILFRNESLDAKRSTARSPVQSMYVPYVSMRRSIYKRTLI